MTAAREEWRSNWPLPFVAMFGVSGCAIFAYSSGAFLLPMTSEFGWSRAAFSTAFLLQVIVSLVSHPLVGRLVDRVGSRKVALGGILPAVTGLSLLGLTGSPLWQWWLFCTIQGLCTAFIIPSVWITAVVGRFHASRGVALAISLAGVGFASAVWPILATALISLLGWRLAFPALGLCWAIVIIPLAYGWFAPVSHGAAASDVGALHVELPKLGPAIRSRSFVLIVAAGGFFGCASFGLIVQLIPLLRSHGVSATAAAAITGLTGLFSITGRLATGFVLDRIPTRPIGIFVFLVPLAVIALLWLSPGSVPMAVLAVALLGLAAGAETDIVFFLIAHQFDHRQFASVASIAGAIFSIFAASGPLLAGVLFDATNSYDAFLAAIAMLAAIAAILISLVPSRTPVAR